MGLALYYKNSLDEYIKVTSSTPIVVSHDGKNGDVKTICLYIRNDDELKWFSNIKVIPIGICDFVTNGWGVKLLYGGDEPTRADWSELNWGEDMDAEDIGSESGGDIVTYSPFWYLSTCPPHVDAQNKTDLKLKLEYTENTVI